jgi:galactose mutarotase-like enzyme
VLIIMSPLLFQGQSVQELRHETSRILCAPEHGGRLLLWEVEGRPLIVWPESADWTKPKKIRGGNPILFPFIARHFVDGHIERWRDAQGVIRTMPMHGFARDSVFSVVPTDSPLALHYRMSDSEMTREYYPYAFEFEVLYRLEAHTLEIEFIITNRGLEPMPYTVGHHFYFHLPHQDRAAWTLELPFAQTGRQDPLGNLQLEDFAPTSTTLADPALVDRFHLQSTRDVFSLTHAEGAQLTFDLGLSESVPWTCVTTWTENSASDFYCIEPWVGLPNAIHHGVGLRWLAPGDTERARCRLNYRSQ